MLKRLFFIPSALFFVIGSFSISGFAQPPAPRSDCKPEINMSSLLNNIHIDGSLRIGTLYSNCLPMPTKKSASNYEYHPYDGGKLTSTLKDQDGKIVNTFFWYGETITTIWELARYEIEGGAKNLQKLSPGKYTIEFAIEDKVIQSFPFSVSTAEGKDKFNPQTLYLLEGAWKDYAVIYAPKIDRFMKLNVWLRDPNNLGEFKPPYTKTKTRLIREKDKLVMAESFDDEAFLLTHKWQRADLSLRKPQIDGKKDYTEFKLSEVVAIDGKYRIELLLNGKLYAAYKFSVKEGKINGIDLAKMQKEEYKINIPLTADFSGK